MESIVEKNGCLSVKPKGIKLTYAEVARINSSVKAQDCLISRGGNPGNDSNPENTNSLDQVDIKVK